MATDYEKVYRESRHALGPPTREFIDYFESWKGGPLRVLDVGCGQGRDALFIARLGHRVVGVDLAPSGIRDLLTVAAAEDLDVQAIVADIRSYEPDGRFNVLLIDRTLHMLGDPERFQALARLLPSVIDGGVVLLADEPSNVPGLEAILQSDRRAWRTFRKRRGFLFSRQSG